MANNTQVWQVVKNSTWIIFAISALLIALLCWGVQLKTDHVEQVPVEVEAQQAARPVQVEKVFSNQTLGGFSSEVPAIDISKRVVAVGEHEPEFRGSKFTIDNRKMWTLQLMKVTEEDIIRSYLNKQDDRSNFFYLRLRDGKNPEQFVLIYGLYKGVKQAIDASQKVDFALPESIKILPEKMSMYTSMVNDLGSEEMMNGTVLRPVLLAKTSMPQKVLEPVKKQLPATSSVPSSSVPNVATTTTVVTVQQNNEPKTTSTEAVVTTTQKPPSNNEVVEQKTIEQPKPSSSEQQVVDPFQ